MDPEAKVSYRGTDGEVGFVSRWESENPDVGVGEQEIVKITANERIDYELRFFEPWESTDNAYLAFEPRGATQTVVKWGFNGKSPFPMSIMLLFMDMEQMLGDDLQTGLDNLKKLMEALPDEQEVVIPMEEVMTDSLSS